MKNVIRKNSEVIEEMLRNKRNKRQAEYDRRQKRKEKENRVFNGIRIK